MNWYEKLAEQKTGETKNIHPSRGCWMFCICCVSKYLCCRFCENSKEIVYMTTREKTYSIK